MIHDILFRAKKLTGEWAYGSLLRYRDGVSLILEERGGQSRFYKVEPDTVSQCTGLTDRNGMEIFEGDIVRYGDTIHEVVFENRCGTAYFGLVYGPNETLPFGHYQDLQSIRVIGNVWDDPELLEPYREGQNK